MDKKQTISFGWLADSCKSLGQYEQAHKNYSRAYELSDQQDYKKSAKEME